MLAAGAAIDLQMHTIYSDGTWTPEQLLDYLVREGFGLGAITDHDRVDTAASLQEVARRKGLPLLVAVEISAAWNGEPVDVLCYGFEPGPNALGEVAQDIARRQSENTRAVCENLRRKGQVLREEQEVAALSEKPSAQQPHEMVAFLKRSVRCPISCAERRIGTELLSKSGISSIIRGKNREGRDICRGHIVLLRSLWGREHAGGHTLSRLPSAARSSSQPPATWYAAA